MTRATPAKRRPRTRSVGAAALRHADLAPAQEALPNRLDDRTFWMLVTEFSEPSGVRVRQSRVQRDRVPARHPDAAAESRNGQRHVGVGPDQNFTYIAALKPRIAFIVDIRRQNMMLHLMYKALIEMSPTRAEFLSRLFRGRCRRGRPFTTRRTSCSTRSTSWSPIRWPSSATARRLRLAAAPPWLRAVARRSRGDRAVHNAFYSAGPDLRYSFSRGAGWQPFPTYRDLMVADDGQEASAAISRARRSARRCATCRNAI